MLLSYTFRENLLKILFSTVIIQLFLIAVFAQQGYFSPSTVTEMLEYSAASGMCALGGGLLLEYIAKSEK